MKETNMTDTHADFSQNDPRWAKQMLGFSSWETIGRYGCAMAAGANIITAQGNQMTPTDVNSALKAHGLFVRDSYGQIADFAGYTVFGAISPHTHFVEQKSWPASQVAPASYFDVRSSVDIEVMAMIDYHPESAGIQTHFVRIIGLNAARNDVEIVDSWDGKRKWLSTIAAKGKRSPLQIIWSAARYKRV
jgi:hypothetical protein